MKFGTMNGKRKGVHSRFPVKLLLDDYVSMRYKKSGIFVDPDPLLSLWTRIRESASAFTSKEQKAGVWLAKHTALLLP